MSKRKKKTRKSGGLKDLPGRTPRNSEQQKVRGGMMMSDVTTEDVSEGGSGTSTAAAFAGAVKGAAGDATTAIKDAASGMTTAIKNLFR